MGKDIGNDLSVLINRFKAGDEDAFEQIYTRCYGHVAYVCTKLCPNKSDVEEIVQDTFMAVYKMAKDLKSDTFMALLRKIAARQCYRKHKTNQEEYILYGDEIMELAAPDTSSLPEAHLDIKESNEELLRIVHQLPPKQQEVVLLHYFMNMSTDEIAQTHKSTPNAVRQALHAARKALKGKANQNMAGVSIGAALLMEETAFAAEYVATHTIGTFAAACATTGTASVAAGAAAGASKVAIPLYIATGVVAVGVACVAAYFALQPGSGEPAYTPAIYQPASQTAQYTTYEAQAPTDPPTNTPIEDPTEPTEAPTEPTEKPTPDPPTEPSPPTDPTPPPADPTDPTPNPPPEDPTQPTPSPPTMPDPPTENPTEPTPAHEPTEPPTQSTPDPPTEPTPPPPLPPEAPPLSIQQPTPAPEPELAPEPDPPTPAPEPEPEPDPEPPPTPAPIDRTPQILAALGAANDAGRVGQVINTYGFQRTAHIRSADGMWYWFYLVNEGSGDILIGITADEDGNDWRMQYQHFSSGPSPTDRLDLFDWMRD